MRQKLLALLVVATMGVLWAPSASAAARSHITIRWNATTEHFHGKVRSGNANCIADRVVKLFKKTADGRVLQGKTHTNENGRWRIEVMHPHGHYFAKAPKKKLMHGTCLAARSSLIDVM